MNRLTREVENEFQEKDIDRVFELLNQKFGFNLLAWKKRFEDYCPQNVTRSQTRTELFYQIGNELINPVVNKILCRREQFPTFNRMVEYVVKEMYKA